MRNLAEKWPEAPDWNTASLDAGGVAVRTLSGLSQLLVSGDLEAWARATGMAAESIGGAGIAAGDRYMARIARDRVLAVSTTPFQLRPGWHAEGFAVSAVDAAMHVFEISGPGAPVLLARATSLDPQARTPSAALQFAGIGAVMYRFGGPDRIRVHADRGLAAYLWQWLEEALRT